MKRTFGLKVGIAIAVFVAILQLVPFYVAVTTSLKSRTENSSPWRMPREIVLANYEMAIQEGHVFQAVLNSIIITATSSFLVCVIGALAAYPLARIQTRLNNFMLAAIVSLMMVPPLSILVPLYSMLANWNGINAYWSIILVMTAGNLPLSIFLYTNFIRGLPVSVEEAASIDGANRLQVLFKIVFPMLKPVTATVVIMAGVTIWNEYQLSSFLLTDPKIQTIAPAIGTFAGQQGSNMGAAAAAALLAALPMVIIYLFMQRYFISGLVAGSGK